MEGDGRGSGGRRQTRYSNLVSIGKGRLLGGAKSPPLTGNPRELPTKDSRPLSRIVYSGMEQEKESFQDALFSIIGVIGKILSQKKRGLNDARHRKVNNQQEIRGGNSQNKENSIRR